MIELVGWTAMGDSLPHGMLGRSRMRVQQRDVGRGPLLEA